MANNKDTSDKEAISVVDVITFVRRSSLLIVNALRDTEKRPVIILFADISGSTKAASENLTDAFINTLAHHFGHSAAANALVRAVNIESVTPRVAPVKTVGDEVIILYELRTADDSEVPPPALSSFLGSLLEAVTHTRSALAGEGIQTKVGVHFCTRYIRPRAILDDILGQYSEEWRKRLQLDAPDPARFFPEDDLIGHDMNLCARVVSSAQKEQVLISEALFHRIGEPDGASSLRISPPIRFQHWKGIVSMEVLESASGDDADYQQVDEMRTARIVCTNTDSDESLRYEWPFQAIALIAPARPDADLQLPRVIAHPELANNILYASAVERTAHARRVTEPPYAFDAMFSSAPQSTDMMGLVRLCAANFEVYNDVMKHCVYARAGANALTYSSAIVTDWHTTEFAGSERALRRFLKRQPTGRCWDDAKLSYAADATAIGLLLRSQSYLQSQAIAETIRKHAGSDLQDCALLYGDWDVLAIISGARAKEIVADVMRRHMLDLRWNTAYQAALALELRALIPDQSLDPVGQLTAT